MILTETPTDIVRQMSVEEKVGQLFVVPGCPERTDDHLQDLHHLFKERHVGGMILKQGTSESYRTFFASLKIPNPLLRIGDAEWGISMRVTDAVKFPRNLTLGAIQDLSLIKKFGHQVGWECRQVGIVFFFVFVADTNTNPLNPIIGTRSFGDVTERVAELVSIVIMALQEEGVLACAKHFPDHGDVSVDSHKDLPTTTIRSLKAFEAAANAHVGALLTAHLLVEDEVVTFSHKLVHELVREKMKYDGLLITDALNMKAITRYTKPGEAALEALNAGRDLLLYGDHLSEKVDTLLKTDIPQAIDQIVQAVKSGHYPESLLDTHVVRIIQAKHQLLKSPPVEKKPNAHDEALRLKQDLFDHAVTVVSNNHLPLQPKQEVQWNVLGGQAPLLQKSIRPSTHGPRVVCVMKWDETIMQQVRSLHPDLLIVMASPYGLTDLPKPPTVIVGYEDDPMAEESVRKVLFGEIEAKGQLPIKL